MSAARLRLGTRRSALALTQTEMMISAMRQARPDVAFEIVPMATEGDERRDVPLQVLGGTGVFVKRLERALLAGTIDVAVHSLKDVPTQLEPGLVLAAIPERADPRDALVVAAEPVPSAASPACSIEEIARSRLPELPYGARVGTSSQRRAAQLRALRDDIELGDVRGNVDTRLRKLDEGQFEALVLAAAGLDRLGRADRITRRLDPDELLPMVGQGALAIETRAADAIARDVAACLDHAETRACVDAERAFLAGLGGGCTLPIGALATFDAGVLRLRVAVARDGRVARREIRVTADAAGEAARQLAAEMLAGAAPTADR